MPLQKYENANPFTPKNRSAKRVMILGANGFIGSWLVSRAKDARLRGEIDLHVIDQQFTNFNPRMEDIDSTVIDLMRLTSTEDALLQRDVSAADVVVDLAAVATPQSYVNNPIDVIHRNFDMNRRIVEMCLAGKTRLVHFSSCEVYGDSACIEGTMHEERTASVLAPTWQSRDIYARAKGLLDAMIYEYGRLEGLDYTIIRPFNFFGPGMDTLPCLGTVPNSYKPRVIPSMLDSLLTGKDIPVVDDGEQRRCFTYIGDAVEAIWKIIIDQWRPGKPLCTKKILNVGDPRNNLSMNDLAKHLLIASAKVAPAMIKDKPGIYRTSGTDFYGYGYCDYSARIPDISEVTHAIQWKPKADFQEAIEETVTYYANLVAKSIGYNNPTLNP